MGVYLSKLFGETNNHGKKSSKNSLSNSPKVENELCTPPNVYKKCADPRSATLGIQRTPIEIESDSPVNKTSDNVISAIPKYLRSKPYLETNIDIVIPPLTFKKRLDEKHNSSTDEDILAMPFTNISAASTTPIKSECYEIVEMDPRSPSANFDRTPILIPSGWNERKVRSCENLNKEDSFDLDIHPIRLSFCESPTSPILSKTYLDCCTEIRDSSSQSSNITLSEGKGDSINDSSSQNRSIPFSPFASFIPLNQPSFSFDVTQIQNDCDVQTKEYKSNETITLPNCNKDDDKIKIWQDSNSLNEQEQFEKRNGEKDDKEKDNTSHNEIAEKQNSQGKTPQNESPTINLVKKKTSNINSKIIQKNSKPMNLIERKFNDDIPKNRTPFGNRSNDKTNQNVGSLSIKLQCNKGSKIQQENTPPSQKSTLKPNLSTLNWDLDSTVVI